MVEYLHKAPNIDAPLELRKLSWKESYDITHKSDLHCLEKSKNLPTFSKNMTMMIRKSVLLYPVLIVLMSMGCKDDEPLTYYVNQEMLRYCWFPVGSYWIYEEENTPGWFDSVYNSNPLHVIEPVEGQDFISEGYSYDLVLRGLKFRQGAQAEPFGSDENVSISYVSEFHSDSSGQVHDYLLFMDESQSNMLPMHPSTMVIQRLDSLVISGATYYSVIEIGTVPEAEADFTVKSIWAKDVGVIRRTLVDGTSWELVRYRIN
jgi:hypothetical protein